MINIYDRLGKAKPASLVDNILTIFDKLDWNAYTKMFIPNFEFCLRDRRGYLLFEEFLEATSQSVRKKCLKIGSIVVILYRKLLVQKLSWNGSLNFMMRINLVLSSLINKPASTLLFLQET